MGVLYYRLEQFDEAIARYEVLIQNREETMYPYHRQALAYRAKGMYDKVREVCEAYLTNFSDDAYVHENLAGNYLCQGKFEDALVENDKAIDLVPASYSFPRFKGQIFQCKGDLLRAEVEFRRLLDSERDSAKLSAMDSLASLYMLQSRFEEAKEYLKKGIELTEKVEDMEWEGDFHFNLARLCLASGNQEEALKECDKAWSAYGKAGILSWRNRSLHYKGLAYLKMKSLSEAQKVAKELKNLIQEGMVEKHIRYYHHLMGMIELERKNVAKAVEFFKTALSLTPSQNLPSGNAHAMLFDSLAWAYDKSEELERAQEIYEKMTSFTVDAVYYGDIYAKSFYMLGKIYEQQGKKAKAIEHYEKFLSLWKDADPGLPEVEDARKRLAGLSE